MDLKELKAKAKKLGIKDYEILDEAGLIAAIEHSEKWNQLVLTAEQRGIDNAKDLSIEELEKLLLALDNTALASKLDVFATTLNIDANLPNEEIEAAIKLKLANNIEVVETKEEPTGKTDETYESKTGKVYGFTAKAPAQFRFAGVVKTQEQWIADKDAMEIMIEGNLMYLETKKTK